MTTRTLPQWQANLALFGVTIVWGATFVVVKDAIGTITPFYFLAGRFSLAALVLALIPGTVRGLLPHWRLVIAPSLMMTSGFALQTLGLQFTTASRAGFITGLSVILVPLIVSLYSRAWPPRQVTLGVTLAALGLFFLSGTGRDPFNFGDALVLGCALSFALQIITIGRRAKELNPLSFALGMTGVAATLFSSLALTLESPPTSFPPELFFALGMTAFLATALAFYVQCRMQQFTSATHTALIFSAEPVFAAVFGYLVAGERLGLLGVLGGAMIVLGIVLAELRPLPAARPA
ncbi:MAG: DMT family transporter [Thermaerobacter sp.]|nr:DMT family transporter [Thermaerobacter sp.]